MVKFHRRVLLKLLLLLFASQFTRAQTKLPHGNNIPFSIIENKDGIQAGGYNFALSTLIKKDRWKAEWIWLNKKDFPQYQRTRSAWVNPGKEADNPYRALFRQNFQLTDKDQKTILHIAADVRYRLYLNGHLVEEGPVNTGSDYDDSKPANYHYFSSVDISKWTRKGLNQLAVEVFSWALEISEHTATYGKLLAEIEQNGKTIVSTNKDWKSIADTSYSGQDGFLQFNAKQEPTSWTTAAFMHWPNSSVQLTAQASILYQSRIPSLLKHPLDPTASYLAKDKFGIDRNKSINTLQGLTAGRYVFDFGKNMSARWKFSVTADNGDTIEVVPFEKEQHRPAIERKFRYLAKQGSNHFESPNLCAFRYLLVTVKSSKPLKNFSINAIFTSYPVNYRGSFECSNDFYNLLWKTARYSTQLCMHDMFFDSPMHQEPIACTGDYLIESINNYYAFGDPFLARQNLVQTAQMMEKNEYKMFHTSYSLLWVQMLYQYVLHTGDSSVLNELIPHAHRLMKRFISYLNKDYLVTEAPNYMFMDWIGINRYNAHHPPAMIGSGYMTAFLYKAMFDIDAMSRLYKKPVLYENLSANIKHGMNKILWDEEKKLYRDGIPFSTSVKPSFWLPADSNLITYSAHVNALSVAYGIAPKANQQTIMDYVVTQTDYELQPYFMFYVLQATKAVNDIGLGLNLVDRWKPAVDTSTGTLKENWQDVTSTGYGGDYSHAWAGAPLSYLSQNVLGIEPTDSPGNYSANLFYGKKIEWAKGKVPTHKKTDIEVSWKVISSGYEYLYNIPTGVRLEVKRPTDCKSCSLALNNKKPEANNPIVLGPGKHRLVLEMQKTPSDNEK